MPSSRSRHRCYTGRMLYAETPLEQTQRHVTEGEARIAKQQALIERLERESRDHPMLPEARKLLADMHGFQELGEEHLEREKAKVG